MKKLYEPPVVTTRDATEDEIASAVQAADFKAAIDQARTYPALAALAAQKAIETRDAITLADVEARAKELQVARISITLGRDVTIIELWGPVMQTIVTKRPFAEVLPEMLGMIASAQQEAQNRMGWWPHTRRNG